MINKMLQKIGEYYPLGAPVETRTMKVSGMNFAIRSFHAEGLGHVSAMEAKGFFGLMQMDTLIITPTAKDLPLYSYDRVHAMGNDTLIFELYDTMLGQTDLAVLDGIKEKYRGLPDHDLGEHWYDSIKLSQSLSKKGKKVHTLAFDTCAMEYLESFLSVPAAPCEAEPKREKASVYVEGLLTNGGPSTDVFKKGIGDEKTAELFRKTLFGTHV